MIGGRTRNTTYNLNTKFRKHALTLLNRYIGHSGIQQHPAGGQQGDGGERQGRGDGMPDKREGENQQIKGDKKEMSRRQSATTCYPYPCDEKQGNPNQGTPNAPVWTDSGEIRTPINRGRSF